MSFVTVIVIVFLSFGTNFFFRSHAAKLVAPLDQREDQFQGAAHQVRCTHVPIPVHRIAMTFVRRTQRKDSEL